MNVIFEFPQEIYDFLQDSIEQLTISNKGVISFQVIIESGRVKKKKVLKIETFKKNIDKIELMALKINKLQKKSKNLEAENQEMKNKINEM